MAISDCRPHVLDRLGISCDTYHQELQHDTLQCIQRHWQQLMQLLICQAEGQNLSPPCSVILPGCHLQLCWTPVEKCVVTREIVCLTIQQNGESIVFTLKNTCRGLDHSMVRHQTGLRAPRPGKGPCTPGDSEMLNLTPRMSFSSHPLRSTTLTEP